MTAVSISDQDLALFFIFETVLKIGIVKNFNFLKVYLPIKNFSLICQK